MTADLRCRVCGSYPAAAVRYRAVAGVILAYRSQIQDGPFCRDCGIAVFRKITAYTLGMAWWSPLSAVLAPAVLIRNGLARRRVGALAAPMDAARNARPMRVGRPIWLRPQIATVLVPIGAIVALVLITMATPGADGDNPITGQCVALDDLQDVGLGIAVSGHVVGCGQQHDGRIRPSDPIVDGSCNVYAEWVVLVGDDYHCVAPTRA